MIQPPHSWVYKGRKLNFKRHMHPNIQCSTAYNTPGMEATTVSIVRWTGNDVAHVHNGILFSHKKGEMVKDREAWCAEIHRVTKVGHDRATEQP